MGEWQPIKTAPRDMTEIIVFDPTNNPPVFTAAYIDGWSCSVERRYAPKDEYFGDREKRPTHWMPLPTPPSTQEATETK